MHACGDLQWVGVQINERQRINKQKKIQSDKSKIE